MSKVIGKMVMFLLVLICVFLNNAYAEEIGNINFQSITIDDGLSQSLAEYIYQDSLGYMWIGTSDGLNRYNGNEFKVYRNIKNNDNSISNNVITSLVEDNYKNLWIGTDSGLNKMNLVTGDITRYLISEEDKTYSNSVIEELMVDSSGELWVCTISGINYYDRKSDKFVTIPTDLFKNTILQDFAEDDEGNIWIATDFGLYRYNPINKKIEEFNDPENIIGKNDIFSMFYEDGRLWLGTKTNGLLIMDLKDYSIKSYRHDPNDITTIPSNFIRDMLRAKDDTMWLATDQGLVLFNEEDGKFYNYQNSTEKHSLCDNNIVSLFEDRLGVIWVGTFSGISKFSINREFKVYRNNPLDDNSLSNNSVCGIYEDDDEMVWVGTFNAGVNRINKKTGEITRYYNSVNDSQTLSSNRIKDITGIENEIWIATDNGLNLYDKNTGIFKSYTNQNSILNNEIRALFIDKDGLLWIGTKGGLYTFDRKDKFISYNGLLEESGIYEKNISAIYEDDDGEIWVAIGNEGGVVRYNRKSGEIKQYISNEKDLNSLSFNTVRAITQDSNGAIWIGTQNGLNKFDKSKEKFTTYTYSDGLSNNFIYGVVVDNNNNIWVSTNYGLSMYDQYSDTFVRYYETDGISSNEFNGFSYHINKDGTSIYFGGVTGLTEIDPNNVKINLNTENVIIDSIKTSGGIEVKERDNIVLDYNSRELYIKFFIPEYKNTNQIQYAYKLEGTDSEWTFLGNENYARYASLEPGKYTMLISGRSYNSVWSDIAEIKIKVRNSIWKSPIAYVMYIVIVCIIVYLFYNQVKILDGLVAQRTQELNNKLSENKKLYNKLIETERYKNNYFINLSHELRTPLNVILSIEQLISSLNSEDKEITKEKMQSYMNALKGNSKRLLNLINNIIDTSKIDSGSYKIEKETTDIVSLVEDTALSMVELAEVKELELIIDPEIEELFIKCDKLDIERCIINLIGNAIKFTEPKGRIIVNIAELNEYVKISVKDTGIGIDTRYHKGIFDRFGQVYNEASEEFGGSGLGLTLTKNLIKLHGGEISVISEKGKGSEFIILLPI